MSYNKWSPNKPISTEWLYKNIDKSKVYMELSASRLETTNNRDLMSLDDYKSVGSYNWALSSNPTRPTVIVPGQADTLCSQLPLYQLRKSKREQMVDENRHFYPDYPLEPLFRSVKICSPNFEFSQVDVVTDRNNLRKLLNFVEAQADESFRIDFQRVGNMLVLIRCEERSSMLCDDYGKDFEQKCTENGLNQGIY